MIAVSQGRAANAVCAAGQASYQPMQLDHELPRRYSIRTSMLDTRTQIERAGDFPRAMETTAC